MWSVENLPMFRRYRSSPSSVKKNERDQILLATCFMMVSFLGLFSALKMEATFSPKRLLTFNGVQFVICRRYSAS
jgi:hypothetical protein